MEIPSTSKRPSNARSSGIPRLRRSNSSSSLPRSSQHISRPSRSSKHTATPRTPRSASTDCQSIRSSSVARSGLSYSAEKLSKDPRLHKDSRPIQDKQWQHKQQKMVESFFKDYPRGLDILNNGKTIRPLTTKMFVESCDFLFKMLDDRISITTANYVEELPILLKKLVYPATVPKSLLSAVNIPRSWPPVLAILSWLVELVQMSELAVPDTIFYANADVDENLRLTKMYLENCIKAYCLYLESVDYETVVDDMENVTASILGGTDEETVSLEENLQTLQAQIQKVEAEDAVEKDKLKYYEHKRKMLNQLKIDIKQLENEESEDKNVTSNYEEKEKLARENMKTLQKEASSLQEEYKNQPIGPKKRDSIVDECKELEQMIARKDQVLSHQKEILYTSELQMAAVYKTYNELVLKYTKLIMSHSAKNPEYGSLLVPDLRYADPELKNILSEKCSEIEALEQQKRLKIIDLKNKLENNDITKLNENMAKRVEELEALESRVAELKLELKAQEETTKSNIINIEKENNSLKHKIQMNKLTDVSEIEKEFNNFIQRKAVITYQTNILCQKAEQFFKELKVVIKEGSAAQKQDMAEIAEILESFLF